MNTIVNWKQMTCLAAIGAIAAPLSAIATQQERLLELEPLTIRPSRLHSEFHLKQDAVIPIIQQDFLIEALDRLSGVRLANASGLAGNVDLIVRGAESNATKVYIDGIEVNDPTNSRGGGYLIQQVSVFQPTAVHLHKGSQSAVWGSDAMAGVLAIDLNDTAGEAGNRLWAQAGTGGFYSVTSRSLQRWGTSSFQAQVGHTREDDRFDGHQFENTGVFLGGHQVIASRHEVRLSTWFSSSDRQYLPDDSGGPIHAVRPDLDEASQEEWGVSLRYTNVISASMKLQSLMGAYRSDTLLDSPGVAPGLRSAVGVPANRFDNLFKRYQWETHLNTVWTDALASVAGVALKREEGESQGQVFFPFGVIPSNYDVSQNHVSPFVELVFTPMQHHRIELAQRVDKVSGFDAEWTSSVRYEYRFPKNQGALRAGYSQGFKVPSLFGLNNTMVGNPDLKPEKVDSWEVGIVWRDTAQNWELALQGFRHHYRNLIELSEVTQRLINISEVDNEGVELTFSWTANDRLQLGAQVSHLKISLDDPDEILRQRPEWIWGAHAVWRLSEDTTVSGVFHWIGERWDSSVPTGSVELGSRSELNMELRHRFSDAFHLSIAAFNLLNDKSEVSLGYRDTGPRLRLFASVEF